MKQKGLIIVYTGNGKGKTTAAFGLCLRFIGHGGKASIIQFIKSGKKSGEHSIPESFKGSLEIHVTGSGFIRTRQQAERLRTEARAAWGLAKEKIGSGRYGLIVLDELTYLVSLGLIPEEDVIRALLEKPASLHIVITGRDAGKALVKTADIVTEMKEVKHSYSDGLSAQKGIEW